METYEYWLKESVKSEFPDRAFSESEDYNLGELLLKRDSVDEVINHYKNKFTIMDYFNDKLSNYEPKIKKELSEVIKGHPILINYVDKGVVTLDKALSLIDERFNAVDSIIELTSNYYDKTPELIAYNKSKDGLIIEMLSSIMLHPDYEDMIDKAEIYGDLKAHCLERFNDLIETQVSQELLECKYRAFLNNELLPMLKQYSVFNSLFKNLEIMELDTVNLGLTPFIDELSDDEAKVMYLAGLMKQYPDNLTEDFRKASINGELSPELAHGYSINKLDKRGFNNSRVRDKEEVAYQAAQVLIKGRAVTDYQTLRNKSRILKSF